MTSYTDMEGKNVVPDSSYDGEHVTIQLRQKGLDFFYNKQKAYAYHEGKVIQLVMTFPDSAKTNGWYQIINYNDTWENADDKNDFQQLIITQDKTIFNPKSKLYLIDIWTDNAPLSVTGKSIGTGSYFRFAVQGVPFIITASDDASPPVNNVTEGTYTYIVPPDNNSNVWFHFKNDRFYAYNSNNQNIINNMVLTFPPVETPNAQVSALFKPLDTNNKYQIVSNTKDGFIYNPVSRLYFIPNNNPIIFSFTRTKPSTPMKYYKGAWNDAITFATDYGKNVLNNSMKYFSQIVGAGKDPVNGQQTFCSYSGKPPGEMCKATSDCDSNQCNLNGSCIYVNYDSGNKEKCINFDSSILTNTKVPVDDNGRRQVNGGWIDATKCPLSYDGMSIGNNPNVGKDNKICKIGGQTPDAYWGQDLAWYPFASGTANSDTIIEFCSSVNENGDIRTDKHPACIAWKNSDDAKIPDSQNRTPIEKSYVYTCTNFINNLNPNSDFKGCSSDACIKDDNCRRSMTNFCQGDNLLTDICLDFCTKSGKCEDTVKQYCKGVYDKTGTFKDPAYASVCGCYYPDDVYFSLLQGLQQYTTERKLPVIDNNISKACYFPQCANAVLKPADVKRSTCPNVTDCIKYTDPNLGPVTGNYDLDDTIPSCDSDKLCNKSMLFNNTDKSCDCPEGDTYDPNTRTCSNDIGPGPSPVPGPGPSPTPSPTPGWFSKYKIPIIITGVILILIILAVIFYQLSS